MLFFRHWTHDLILVTRHRKISTVGYKSILRGGFFFLWLQFDCNGFLFVILRQQWYLVPLSLSFVILTVQCVEGVIINVLMIIICNLSFFFRKALCRQSYILLKSYKYIYIYLFYMTFCCTLLFSELIHVLTCIFLMFITYLPLYIEI